jgi:hypothetical protein
MKTRRRHATHPVKKAILRDNLRKSLVDQRIQLYLQVDGEPCAPLCEGVGMLLSIVGYAATLAYGSQDEDLQVLDAGLEALRQMADDDRWDITKTQATVDAIDSAERLHTLMHPRFIAQSLRALNLEGVRL